MTDWVLKIIALLHDPPEKTLGLEGHQRRAFQLMEQVIGTEEFKTRFRKLAAELTRKDFEASTEGMRIKQADQIASAIDRAAFPNSVRLESSDFMRNPQIRHPFCGEPFRLEGMSGADAIQSQTDLILGYVNRQADMRKKYLALWRAMPLLVSDAAARLLPSDTRIVDHPLWAHLDATSALATALPGVLMLHVGIGPVQDFIREARRTQDLWMGSYLLSYLTWKGIQAVVEQHGPDSIIYPSLRGQSLVDKWLESELGGLPPGVPSPDLTMATIPNKFVAFVPAGDVREDGLPDRIVGAVRGAWREIAQAVHDGFPGGPQPGEWERIWSRQTQSADWPEIYWSAVRWPDVDCSPQLSGAEESLRIVEAYLGEQIFYRQLLKTYRQSWPAGTHSGTMYGALYRLLTAAMDARKRSRDFAAREEDGEKCTVMPTLSALRLDGKSRRAEVSKYWQGVADTLRQQNRAHEIKADGSERLSAAAAIKRFAQQSYFRPHGIRLAFPSTSRLAAVPFYRRLLERLPNDLELQQRLRDHLEALEKLRYPQVSDEADEKALPALRSKVEALEGEPRSLAESLFQFEADVLYPERLTADLLQREYGAINRQAAEKAQQTCRELGKAVCSPPTYYAILVMDGDDMGKWLAGEHPQMPHFRDAMHPEVLPRFGVLPEPERSNWKSLLDSQRPLAANLHASLSGALSTFALRGVKFIVEERHFGRVVYAGGDNLLAFLPLVEALAAARELYMLFTGRARVVDGKLELDPSGQNGYVRWNDEILLMPGPRITLSAGLTIAHHLYPLDAALEAAREAEKAAKSVPGKSAVCVRVLKRIGETVQMRSKWDAMGDTFGRLIALFKNEALSSKLPYAVAESAFVLPRADALFESELRRLLRRHRHPTRWQEDEAQWAATLQSWAATLPEQSAELARWLTLARFIAQGGE